nr:unnamed protein product [Digitaria exilis]
MNITVDAPELEELDVGCTVGYAGSFTLRAPRLRCLKWRSLSLPNQAPHVCYCSYAGSAPCYYPAPVSAAPSYTPSDHLLHSNVRIELLHTQELCRMGIISLWVLTYMKARYCSDQFCTSYDYDYDNTRCSLG